MPAVQALVSHDRSNAELKDQTENEATPLHHAAEENRTHVIEFLNSQYHGNIYRQHLGCCTLIFELYALIVGYIECPCVRACVRAHARVFVCALAVAHS